MSLAHKTIVGKLLLFGSAFLIETHFLTAQSQMGALTGTVVNEVTQEPIPGANVFLLETQIGASSDTDGNFTIKNVPIGTYRVRVSAVGYRPLVLSDIVVAVGRPVDVHAKLAEMPIDLGTVEITGSYFRKSPDAAVSVQQLSYEEIRRSPGGFEDVVRAISVLPGVAQAQPGRNDLVVRGGAPSENLYVIDNIEVPNINHFGTRGAGGGPLSFVNLDFVRETSFSTGGFGVRYGDRLSSVLNIDLQEGRSDRIGGKATISASQFGLNVEGPATDHGTFLFSARRSYLDLIFKAAGFSFVPEYWDFLGRVSVKLDKANELTFLSIGAIDDVSFFNSTADNRFDNSTILGTAQRQYIAGMTWRHLMGTGYVTTTLGRSFVNYNGIQRDSLLRPIFTDQSKEGETSLRLDAVMQVNRTSELSFGAGIKRIKFSTNLALPDFVSTFGDTLNVPSAALDALGYKGSAYVQLSHRFVEKLHLTVGGRLEYFSLTQKKFNLAPRSSLSYDFTDLTSVSASAGLYYQFPSYVWLVANPANRDLKAARATQYILGVEHLLRPDLRMRLEAFVKRYADYPASEDRRYLVLANTGAGYGGTEDNFASYGLDHLVSGGSGESHGIEFMVQQKLADMPLYGLASITLSNTRFTALDGIERPGAFDQELLVTLSAGYRFDERWEASMKFRFASGQPYTPFNANGTQNVAAYNSLRVKNAHSLDLRVDRRWSFTTWNLVAYVDIQNVYNNKFTGAVRWNAREQRVESDENGIGILPSIGISAEL